MNYIHEKKLFFLKHNNNAYIMKKLRIVWVNLHFKGDSFTHFITLVLFWVCKIWLHLIHEFDKYNLI